MTGNVRVSVDVSLSPEETFDGLVDELGIALEKRGFKFDAGAGGSVTEKGNCVGSVREWKPGERISLQWRPKNWNGDEQNEIVVDFASSNSGTTITFESFEWGRVLGDDKRELLGWFTSEVSAQLLFASSPHLLGDWITDRLARSPSGPRSRGVYKNPIYHWPNFYAILDRLSLGSGDYLLEVGCGGGAFLHEALKSGCRAAAIDHSADMVRVASEANSEAISEKRLTISKSEAESLPFQDGMFSRAVMTGVLGFLPDPSAAFKEVFRVLRTGGRFVAFTSTKELKGTPAISEPVESRVKFYEDEELERLAKDASFSLARVEHPSFFDYAVKAGVPSSDLELFSRPGGAQLLVAEE